MWLPTVVTSAPNPWTLALPGPFNGLQIMIYLLLYLIIILLETPLVLSAMAVTRQRFRAKSLDCSVPETYINLEPFTCLRAGLKRGQQENISVPNAVWLPGRWQSVRPGESQLEDSR